MTPEQALRLKELPSLIEKERDYEKVVALAVELEHLLKMELKDLDERH